MGNLCGIRSMKSQLWSRRSCPTIVQSHRNTCLRGCSTLTKTFHASLSHGALWTDMDDEVSSPDSRLACEPHPLAKSKKQKG